MSAPVRVMLRRRIVEQINAIGRTPFMVNKSNELHSDLLTSHVFARRFGVTAIVKSNTLLSSTRPQGGRKTDKPTFTLSKTTRVWSRLSSTLTGRTCWKCGKTKNGRSELFICECGIVQEVSDLTYFQILDSEETFDVDLKVLALTYKELQKILHPDKYSQKTEKERDLAEIQSSLVNKAYTTLTKPLSRALYLLELNKLPIEEANSDVDPDFLMEIMEINEELADADSPESLQKIQTENNERVNDCFLEISKAFQDGNITLAREHVIRMTYFVNIDEKIKETYRKSFE
ncbi:iron-sulfur cluster co-chaperone protein HscB-like [Pecten maximus]|uniref:iron-sulfur cluster co-chaperone protein HscB-like n=1 Tax=Pecten maximus TaxID=6579 RepID=UPI0014581B9F|nr:iron-sulfur cluster co-chaperone protein HscB-like [Pecten maximus]